MMAWKFNIVVEFGGGSSLLLRRRHGPIFTCDFVGKTGRI